MRGDALGFPITLDVEDEVVVVVGDDADAARKRALLEDAGARVTQLDADAFVDDAHARAHIAGARLVLLSLRDKALAGRVSAAARACGVPAWCSDDPARSDFAMPAVAQLGPLRITISTAGGSPTLAGKLRAIFEKQLGERFADFARALAKRRKERSIEARRADVEGLDVDITVRYPDWFK
jgi:uroporphyrin-III C-methyltransferase / precorrin-2 dehydrogenase / sirohydrochlorin ferrochelatase